VNRIRNRRTRTDTVCQDALRLIDLLIEALSEPKEFGSTDGKEFFLSEREDLAEKYFSAHSFARSDFNDKVRVSARHYYAVTREQYSNLIRNQDLLEFIRLPLAIDEGGLFCVLTDSSCPIEALFLARSELENLFDSLPEPKMVVFNGYDSLTFLRNCMRWPGEKFISFAKYHCAAPMAFFLENPLPSRPNGFSGHFLVWGGKILKYLKNRLRTRIHSNVKHVSLFWGMCQGVKRGAAVVSDDFVLEAKMKHFEALRHPPPDVPAPLRLRIEAIMNTFLDAIPFSTSFGKLHEASRNAHIGANKAHGGGRSFLIQRSISEFGTELLHNVFPDDIVNKGFDRIPFDDLHRMCLESLVDNRFSESVSVQNPITGKNENRRFSVVEVCEVLEPLKVRLISKGNPYTYYYSKFFQKDLWKYMSNFSCFRLTGRPLKVSDFHSLERGSGVCYPLSDIEECIMDEAQYGYVSGDYKGATDSLNIQVTKTIFECFLARTNMPEDAKDILRSVLYEQYLTYGRDTQVVGSGLQLNGQLMGSPLSFPILCWSNLIAYIISYENYFDNLLVMGDSEFQLNTEQILSLRKGVLVNGDDILFRSSLEHYEFWKQAVKSFGFELSIGKNYRHNNLYH